MTFLDFHKCDNNFLNQMFERSITFKTLDLSNVDETNDLMKPFYKNINHIKKDNYPTSTKMVWEQFYAYNNRVQAVNMAKIYDLFNGGNIKNDKATAIAKLY